MECKQCLIKARHVAPSDTVVLYNLGKKQTLLKDFTQAFSPGNATAGRKEAHRYEIKSQGCRWRRTRLGTLTKVLRMAR